MNKRRTAAEIIGFHFCSDIRDIQDCRYQSTRYRDAIYAIGDDYFAAPASNRPPAAEVGQPWEEIGEHYGRKVWRSKMATRA